MLEPDFDQEQPSQHDILRFWRHAAFSLHVHDYPAVQAYLRCLGVRYGNGTTFFRSFHLPADATLDWFISRNRLDEIEFPVRPWQFPPVASHLSELQIPSDIDDIRFEWVSAFAFAGELASTLYRGGAYHSASGTGTCEMQMAIAASDELIEGRFSEIVVYCTHEAWSDFFFGVAWDSTWLLLDKRKRLLHVIAATDTD